MGCRQACRCKIKSSSLVSAGSKFSCHGSVQQIPPRVPSAHRIIRRKVNIKIGHKWRTRRGVAPKQGIGVTMASKNITIFLMHTFCRKKTRFVRKEGHSQVAIENPNPGFWNQLHFRHDSASFTLIAAPVEVVKNGGGWVCVVIYPVVLQS